MVNGKEPENRSISSKTPFKKGFCGFVNNFIKAITEKSKICEYLNKLLERSI